jgi:hypothetical protein
MSYFDKVNILFLSLILHKMKDDGLKKMVNMGDYDNQRGHQREE